MKGIEIFCASQASTAICLNTNHASSSSTSSSNTINHFGGRAIDRHNPIITDPKRTPARDLTDTAPRSPSPSPINLKLVHEKAKKNTASKLSDKKKKNATKSTHEYDQKKKKSTTTTEKVTEHIANNYSSKPVDSILRRSRVKPPSDLITPPTSSRYLLGGETVSLDGVLDYDPVLGLTKVDDNKKKAQVLHEDEDKHSSKQYSSSSVPKSSTTNQIVVLRVSLHCKGCEGKVRKHLSRMQGVTSFNIDFAAKKVTVVGDVTPLSVMASISKVKTAQIWPEVASSIGSGAAEAKKTNMI